MGYAVRGRVGETYWPDEWIGPELARLLGNDVLTTHFYIEAQIDGSWRALDPSFQPALKKYGFQIGSWDGGEVCFPITRLYTLEESIEYQKKWFDPAYQEAFFAGSRPVWERLKAYFDRLERETAA
jgi:hypothetical protein